MVGENEINPKLSNTILKLKDIAGPKDQWETTKYTRSIYIWVHFERHVLCIKHFVLKTVFFIVETNIMLMLQTPHHHGKDSFFQIKTVSERNS